MANGLDFSSEVQFCAVFGHPQKVATAATWAWMSYLATGPRVTDATIRGTRETMLHETP